MVVSTQMKQDNNSYRVPRIYKAADRAVSFVFETTLFVHAIIVSLSHFYFYEP